MSEFGSRPLVAGSLTGIRAFKVRGDGLLRSVTGAGFEHTFTDGENVARCYEQEVQRRLHNWPGMPQHDVASLPCSCGFYAYHPRKLVRRYGGPNTVAALVRGYGTVTVGSRGFRAEKLRILCLINPIGSRLAAAFTVLSVITMTILILAVHDLGFLSGFLSPIAALLVPVAVFSPGATVRRRQFATVRERYPSLPVHFRWYATWKYRGLKPPKDDT